MDPRRVDVMIPDEKLVVKELIAALDQVTDDRLMIRNLSEVVARGVSRSSDRLLVLRSVIASVIHAFGRSDSMAIVDAVRGDVETTMEILRTRAPGEQVQ